MIQIGPDVPFILYTYAIYLSASGEEDWEFIQDLVRRAHKVDPRRKYFKLARKGFFRMATLLKHGKARAIAHFHYALCLQINLEQYRLAREQYIKSIELMSNDHRSIEFKRVIDNFNFLMSDLLKSPHDGVEEYKLYQERIALKEAEEWNKHGRFEFAARTVQRYARRRLARIRVRKIKSSEQYRLRMKRKMVGVESKEVLPSSILSDEEVLMPVDFSSGPPGILSGEESEESSLPPGILSDEERKLTPSILSGEESSLPPGILSGEESSLPPGILSGEESNLPPGILSGEESSLPPGILSGEENINTYEIGKEDSSDSDEDDDRRWRTLSNHERWYALILFFTPKRCTHTHTHTNIYKKT